METPVQRRQISAQLIEEISEGIAQLQSALIIAANFGGKSFVADRVQQALPEYGVIPVRFEFSGDLRLITEDGVLQARRGAGPDLGDISTLAQLFASLLELHKRESRPVCLMLCRLDRVSRELAQRFLKEVRTATNSPLRWMSTVITVEAEILDMVLGVNSEFNCANQYVLQGFDGETFSERFEVYRERLSVDLRHPDEARNICLHLTGGSTYLGRHILLQCAETQLSKDGVRSQIETAELERIADRLSTPGSGEFPLFRQTAIVLEGNLGHIEFLRGLNPQAPLPAHPGTPSALELCGAVVNRKGLLYFSSPLIESFFNREFHARRVGDLHALAGNWDQAFSSYRGAQSHQQNQPSLHQRVVTQEVLRRLCETLTQTPADRLRTLFRDSLRFIFSIDPDVNFHECRSTKDGLWIAEPPGPSWIMSEAAHRARYDLTGFDRAACWFVASPDEVLVVRWPEDLPRWLRQEISPVLQAYGDNVRSGRHEAAGRSLDAALRDTTRELHERPGGARPTPQRLLEVAMTALWRDGFRVSGCLEALNVWSGPDPGLAVSDALATEGLITALAPNRYVIRLIHGGSESIGALVLEFPFSRHLKDQELDDVLADFGSQLASSLAYCEDTYRASLALDKLAETVLVLDHKRRLCFSNRHSQKLWPDIATKSFESWDAHLLEGIVTAMQTGRRYANFPPRIGGDAHEGIVVYEPLSEKDHLLGVLVHVQHKSYYADILSGFKVLAAAHDETAALEGLLDVFRNLGVSWVRLYRIEGNQLRPERCIDPGRPDVQAAFPTVVLPERDGGATWHVIQEREPHVFSYREDKPEGAIFFTAEGLPVMAQHAPPAVDPLGKVPGDVWVDFPLMRGDNVIGKYTVPCPDQLTPERFQMFSVLSGLVSETLLRLSEQGAPLTAGELASLKVDMIEALAPLDVLDALLERAFSHEMVGRDGVGNVKKVFGDALRNARGSIRVMGSEA